LLATKEYSRSIEYALDGLHIAESINLKDQLRDCNETLSRIYKAQRKYEKALYHFELFKLYADSINNSEITKKTASLEAQYEFDKREALLTAEQAKLNVLHEKDNIQLKWFIATSIIGLISVSIIAFLINRSRSKMSLAYKKLEEATNEINSKSEALRDINVALMKQKSEVVEQRDLVTLQNKKLQEISFTLEQHRQNLELEVEKRTLELAQYERRMEQFAFFTAHDLRAPVATILGLANLLSYYSNSPEDKHVIFEKLVFTTRKLDTVVRQLNQSIEERNAIKPVVTADVV
jgi:signal transduction histidine kinase